MRVELHMLQNFAPSNLNRDDTGAPKDCDFGGYRRARISSQAIKRAMRKSGVFARYLDDSASVRTRRLIVELAERIDEQSPASAATIKVVSEVFAAGGIERPSQKKGDDEIEKDTTRILIHLNASGIDAMEREFRSRWTELTAGSSDSKSSAVAVLGTIVAEAVTAPDIALFGRMIEIDQRKPFGKLQLGIDAASQVAHAISTNRVNAEFDFFTAVDDLLPKGKLGAGMMDVTGFNSSCFYRYANVDLVQLTENLKDNDLVDPTLEAFLWASVAAIPTGKQNSFAAQNPPSFVLAVVRDAGMWSLANAFVNPVRPGRNRDLSRKVESDEVTSPHAERNLDLISNSVSALDNYWGKLADFYGNDGVVGAWCINLTEAELPTLSAATVASFRELVDNVLAAARGNGGGAA